MDFNFDALEDDLAGEECPDPTSMSEEDLAGLGKRLRSAVLSRNYKELDQSIAEALWVKQPRRRVGTVARELVGMLRELSERTQEQDSDGGCAVAHALFRLSLSSSLDRALLSKVATPVEIGPSCALILLPAGADADEPEPRSASYAGRGLSTVSACRCTFPTALQRSQEQQLVEELQEALASADASTPRRLVVHLCGRHGFGWWCQLAPRWAAGQGCWGRLPRLQDCLAGLVLECCPHTPPELEDAPAAPAAAAGVPGLTLQQALSMQRELLHQFSQDDFMDRLQDLEETHKMGSPKFIGARNKLFLEVQGPIIARYGFEASHKGVSQMLVAAARHNGHQDYRRNVDRLNCLLGINAEGSIERERRVEAAKKEEALVSQAKTAAGQEKDPASLAACAEECLLAFLSRHLPELDVPKLLSQPDVQAFISGAASRGAFWLGGDFGTKTDSGQPLWGDSQGWEALDAAMQPRAPRLFLSAKSDRVAAPATVRLHYEWAQQQQSEVGDVLLQELQGEHLQLWEANRPGCERAMGTFLRRTCA